MNAASCVKCLSYVTNRGFSGQNIKFFNVKIDLQNVQVGTAVEFPSPSNTGQYLAILASTVSSTLPCVQN